jgi:SAM-dependent methyltransferase
MLCPICNDNNSPKETLRFYEIDKDSQLEVKYHICKCGFMFYRHTNIEKAYKENNKYINRNTGSGADEKFDIIRLNQSFSAIASHIKKSQSVLDVGCNNGNFLKLIQSHVSQAELFGTDIEINPLKKSELQQKHISILKTKDLSETNKKFDFITVLHVLEHVDDINAFADSLEFVSHDTTKVYIEVPNADGYLENYFQPFSYFDLEHINHFNVKNLCLFLSKKGYTILETHAMKISMSDDITYPAIGVLIEKTKNQNIDNYIKKSIQELSNYRYKKSLDNKVLFGVGANTLRTLGLLNTDISKVKYFVDNNQIFHGRTIAGKTIQSADCLVEDKSLPDVIIFSKLYFDEIRDGLLKKGFKGKIYSFF